MQKFNLFTPNDVGPRFTITDRVWPAAHGDADVCLWADDKMAAVSQSIDDNWISEHDWWFSIGTKFGFTFTWFTITDGINIDDHRLGNWSHMRNVYAQGHEVQGHGIGGINNDPLNLYEQNLRTNQQLLQDSIPGNQCLVYAYPWGREDGGKDGVAAKLYIAARTTVNKPDRANQINYLRTNDAEITKSVIDEVVDNKSSPYWRAWVNSLRHSVEDEVGFASMESRLSYVKSREADIWVGTFREVALYGQERDTHTLSVTSVTGTQVTFTLIDSMLDTIYDFPLTVKVRIDSSWSQVSAVQGGNVLESKVVMHNNNKYALVKAVPDQGQVVLSAVEPTFVLPPAISPAGGIFDGAVEVSLSTITAGAGIYYTKDGTDPTKASTAYSTTPFTITLSPANASVTIKAQAYKSGLTESTIAQAVFTYGINRAPIMIEAETMILNGYMIDTGQHSLGRYIMVNPDSSSGTATHTFSGISGAYKIDLYVRPEQDGAPQVTLSVGTNQVLYETFPIESGGFDLGIEKIYTVSTVSITTGDEIKIEATADQLAYARVDKIVLTMENASRIPGKTEYQGEGHRGIMISENPMTDYVTFTFNHQDTKAPREIIIFDQTGKIVKNVFVKTIHPSPTLSTSSSSLRWYGTDEKGTKVQPGIYMYSVMTDGRVVSGKIVKLK